MTKTPNNRTAAQGALRVMRDDDGPSLRLYGIVGDDFDGFTDDSVRDALEGRTGFDGEQLEDPVSGPLNVRLNSVGGLVDQGMAIYAALRERTGGVTIHVDGLAASIASVIAMAGTVRMHPGSMLMIHNPWNLALGDAAEMRKNADMLDKWRDAIVAIYVGKTGQSEDRIKSMLDAETWLTAQEALDLGFADEVIEAESTEPAARAIASLDLSVLQFVDSRVAAAAVRYANSTHMRSSIMTRTAHAGPALASLLNDAIDAIDNSDSDDRSRADVVAQMSDAAGISESTVNGILNAEINCPPIARLEGFAQVDGLPAVSSQRSAAEEDGCDYSEDGQASACPASPQPAGSPRTDRAADPSANHPKEDETMTRNQGQTAAAGQSAAKSEEQIRNEAKAAERERVAEIQRSVRAAKLPQDFADELIRNGDSVDQARAKVIDRWQADANEPDTSPVHRVQVGRDASDKFRTQATDAILMRGGQKPMDASNEMRGFGLMDHARAALDQAGYRTAGMGKTEIARAVLSTTTDFPNIFENAMHKTLLGAYEGVDLTWNRIAATGDLSDFRPHNRYRMGSFGRLKGLDENGEIRHVNMPDAEKEAITAGENGLIFTLSFKMLVNDDMGAFLNVAQGLGRTAALSVEEDFYNLLTSNPTMSDGNSLFDTSNHNNLASSGTKVSVDSLGKARAAMRKQKDPGGNSYAMLRAALLVTPEDIESDAWQTIMSQTDPSKSNSDVRNPENNRWTHITSPYLDEDSATAWYAFADPAQAPAFEVGFVDGQTTPMVETEESFDSRGIKYRVTHDYGVAARDYRPAYKNPGA